MPDFKVATIRDAFSEFWHHHASHWMKQRHCGFSTGDQYQAFCIAKDQIQDTAEAMLCHRRRGFSPDPFAGYVEFWGVLQAVVLQQDAIREMEFAATGTRPTGSGGVDRSAARKIRNLLAGHSSWNSRDPDGIKRRCTIRRQNMGYQRISYTVYENGDPKCPVLNLGDLLDRYDEEAANHLEETFSKLRERVLAPSAVAGPPPEQDKEGN